VDARADWLTVNSCLLPGVVVQFARGALMKLPHSWPGWAVSAALLVLPMVVVVLGSSHQFRTCLGGGATLKSCLNEYIEGRDTALTVLAALVTMLAAIATAYFTGTIWDINRRQLQHGRQVERGYVYGGFGDRGATNRYFASIHNNGKTPVVIDHMLVGICPLKELPQIPDISKRTYVNYSIPPQTRIVAYGCYAVWNGEPDHVFFGRFWYTDIFEEGHESGFALHLKEGMPAADIPEYWRWT